MNQELFEKRFRDEWLAFDTTLHGMEKNRELNDPASFPHAYRRLCKHLALARDRQYSVHLVNELNAMAKRAHSYLYKSQQFTVHKALRVFTHDFPQAVRKNAGLFWLSSLLFYGPFFAVIIAINQRPELAYSFMSDYQITTIEEMYDPNTPKDRGAAEDVMMFGFYIQNNVGIAFRTFASGLLFGVGSVIILLFNGFAIGSVAGHLIEVGFQDTFLRFVCGHSPFELTAIVLAGMAGMKLGFSLLLPGNHSRRRKMMETAHGLLPVVYGMGVMLVIAAFIEAFWSPRTLTAALKYGFSGFFWLLLAAYFLYSGRENEN